MQLASAPAKLVEAFANGGDKNAIPVTTTTPGAASWDAGFPPLTRVGPTQGGIGPSGLDFNGILNALSALNLWFNAGAAFPYDATFSATVGGYPKGARLLQASGTGYWISAVDNNLTDPDTGGLGWVPEGGATASSVYASAQQTLAAGSSKIMFDTVEFDAGLWNSVNKRLVAPYPGLYRMSGSVYLPSPGGQNFATQVWHNGALAKQCCGFPQVSDEDITLPFGATVNMAVGDYLEAYLVVSQTAVLAGQVGSNQAYVFAQVEYLGA